MPHLILLTLSLLLYNLVEVAGEFYHITATSSQHCTSLPCLTFQQFAANPTLYLSSNTTLVFLPGRHLLALNLTFSNLTNFSMTSENWTAQIECEKYLHIHFNHSQCINITNLEFIGCGGNRVENVDEFVLKDAKFKGQESSGPAFEFIKTTAKILSSSFVSNQRGKNYTDEFYGSGYVGGAIIVTRSTVDVIHSSFESNTAEFGGAIYAEKDSMITMDNNTFFNNYAFRRGGALYVYGCNVTIKESRFDNCAAALTFAVLINGRIGHDGLGGALYALTSNITIKASVFDNNRAFNGGALFTQEVVTIYGRIIVPNRCSIQTSLFVCNRATRDGGAIYSGRTNTTIEASNFVHNTATRRGGAVSSYRSRIITIRSSKFHSNTAWTGGVLFSLESVIVILASEFVSNIAKNLSGGVLDSINSTTTIEGSKFIGNNAVDGGALYLDNSNVTLDDSRFINNNSTVGAAFSARFDSNIEYHNYILVSNNSVDRYGVISLDRSTLSGNHSAKLMFSNNLGSLVAFNANITFRGYARFANNHPQHNLASATDNFQKGGAITLFQSSAFFEATTILELNEAQDGGALMSVESKLYVSGNTVILAHNRATRNGGAIYFSYSELNCQWMSHFILFNNSATYKGGGIHAISSYIRAISSAVFETNSNYPHIPQTYTYTGARLHFSLNTADYGGGLSLEANAKLYLLKYDYVYVNISKFWQVNTAVFKSNTAQYGGAVYVDDETNSGTCASTPKTECFFQVLALHGLKIGSLIRTESIQFSKNHANISGSTLYGGLLDRCAVSQFAEVLYKNEMYLEEGGNGISYLSDISDANSVSISSHPVKVCLCINNQQSCMQKSRLHDKVEAKKGEVFTVSLIAVDHIGHPVSGTIQASLKFTESGLAEGQLSRRITGKCTDLVFNIVSPHNFEELTLYASDGPCKDTELSKMTIGIEFLPCNCPIGFEISEENNTNCTCDCHKKIRQHVEMCNIHTGYLFKTSQTRAWISYINDFKRTGYLVYSNCPFDYCNSLTLPIDLNKPNGADTQCAFNRSSLLCGSCHPDLSLSLGSSYCLPCPSYWPALLIAITIAAVLAGIALVALLQMLNMTVAIGTMNGLIFYVNVVYANKDILLPFPETNFLTVFVSWLNFDLGINTCYFPGMDTYIRTWLQLVFPAYDILLVVMVIIVTSHSLKVSKFVGKNDPVATLATLILLSYAKLLEICFKSLSVAILEFPDGSSERLWLPDATVKYLNGKHIPLFIVAVLVLLAGLVYAVLLFSWQWLLCLPKWKLCSWTRYQKLQMFIETYHKPYTPKHRYWTGLLLLVRAVLYLVAAVNVSNNPHLALTAITFTVSCIVLLKAFFGSRVYRIWAVDVLEIFFYLNILFFAIFTWYSLNVPESNQEAVAYTSVITVMIALLLIILYHVYTYTSVFSALKPVNSLIRIRCLMKRNQQPKHKHESPPPEDDIHRFHELLDIIDRPVNTNDYNIPQAAVVAPTHTVVEINKPYNIAPTDSEENDARKVSDTVESVLN